MVTVAMTSWSPAAVPAMAAARPCICRSASSCSSLLGAAVHGSASSPAFQQNRASLSLVHIQPRRSQRGPRNLAVRGLFGLGVPELAVIAGVAAILFGPKKLPEIGKSLGKTVKSFQQAAKEFESEIKNPQQGESSDAETTNVEKPTATPVSSPTSSTGSDKEVL
ncbi:sec-independent protein translocase protein TatA [Marchantia polymorpha subsp. ruderalis]|uniref:Sec-independent protein translocase protein TATA, chloroplastic n=2 Tax=Marchantia polymorpha TaxID=3197 RepID=A0AAF6ARG1_MARPO|nr:hypothetical protein MARPO_0001s0151 [Marchantia polymorpha]BBM99031.1 hypothetical protein Mp_1g18130 [Marchantia polymorpha subsp. ruderalis]|eukprot:PTQ50106.1 hypothetical protein MARPO_0001s0151 [Marchantia polymorpha]